MLIEDHNADGILVLKVCDSRVDAHNAAEFKSTVAEFVSNGNNKIALDLSEVEFIDSSGLGAIVAGLKAVGREGSFSIFGLQSATLSMFRMTRMDKVFQIFESESEALAA
ncbi:MAG: STAS domain-containing protein [Gammaproteobacteria bacterium]|nr:STAS domain-containing protein [Gammaproteobacteria bacterium]